MSLYDEVKHKLNNSRSVYPSRLLKDVKEGKKPEKKHVILDHFFKEKSLVVLN